MGEELAYIAPRPRAPRGAGPAQAMGKVLTHAFAADAMIHDVGRQANDESKFGGDSAEHVVFRAEIILDAFEAAESSQHMFAGHNGGADGKLGAFHHDRREQAGVEIGVHAKRFEAGPDRFPGDGSVWASDQA